IFESFQSVDGASMHYHTVSDYSEFGVTSYFTIRYITTCNSTHFGDFEHFSHIHVTNDSFLDFWRQKSLNGRLNFFNCLINDGVMTDIDLLSLRQFFSTTGRANLEPNNDGIRSRSKKYV